MEMTAVHTTGVLSLKATLAMLWMVMDKNFGKNKVNNFKNKIVEFSSQI